MDNKLRLEVFAKKKAESREDEIILYQEIVEFESEDPSMEEVEKRIDGIKKKVAESSNYELDELVMECIVLEIPISAAAKILSNCLK